MKTINKGDISILNTNHFIDSSILIGANHEYTSPFLNVYEIKQNKFHSSIKIDLGSIINTIYYNSKSGKFERKNFNSNTLNFVINKLSDANLTSIDLDDSDLEVFENEFYLNFINKLVILNSVDLELKKKALRESNDFEKEKFTFSSHLEFLPPVMTIIGYKFSDDKKKICEETGDIKLEFKCKWYNSATKSFSEEYLPYQILAFIENNEELNKRIELLPDLIDSNKIIQIELNNPIILKNNEGKLTAKKISYELLKPHSIAFYHYYHQLLVKSLFSDKIRKQNINIDYKICDNVLGVKFQKDGDRDTIHDFVPNEYYLVKYKDRNNNITNRIIRVNKILVNSDEFSTIDLFDIYIDALNPEEKIKAYQGLKIETNCLLRRGAIRNFRLQGMLEITGINRFGEDEFFFESEYNLA